MTIMQLKVEIENLKKEGLTITEYMMKMKSLIDSLATVGCKVIEEDQIIYYLGGLDQDFDTVYINVTSRISQVSVKDLHTFSRGSKQSA